MKIKVRVKWLKGQEVKRLKNLFALLPIYLFTYLPLAFCDPGVHPAFGSVQKKISIQRGSAISVWLDRGDVAKSSAMTPVGDGTWEIFVNLIPNATYNFMFFAVPTGPVAGLTVGATYYDTPPTDYSGTIHFPTSTSSSTIVGASTGWFGKAGPGDDRRLVHIPPGGSTYYVFCNFAHTPNPPSNFNANPSGGTHITLSWNYPKDSWNATDLADVVAGGQYFIYRSTIGAGGPFSLLLSTGGAATQHKDIGLTTGVTYYYVIVSSDAYRGTTRTGKTNQEGIDDNFIMSFPDLAQDSAKPTFAVPTIFRVDNSPLERGILQGQSESPLLRGVSEEPVLNLVQERGVSPLARGVSEGRGVYKIDAVDYAKIGDNALVYLTPWTEDGKTYAWKIKGRITSVYLPKVSNK